MRLKDRNLKLPSLVKGWLNNNLCPEQTFKQYRKTGDVKHLEALCLLFNKPIFHYLLSQSTKEVAEDVLQSVWEKVIAFQRRIPSPHSEEKSIGHVKSWLFTIARNTLIDELRKQNKWQVEDLSEQEPISVELEKEIEKLDQLSRLNLAIAKLSFQQKEAFILQQEGFSIQEIAALTHSDHETIKSRLRYARNNIRALVGLK